jgi:hypothetical protein
MQAFNGNSKLTYNDIISSPFTQVAIRRKEDGKYLKEARKFVEHILSIGSTESQEDFMYLIYNIKKVPLTTVMDQDFLDEVREQDQGFESSAPNIARVEATREVPRLLIKYGLKVGEKLSAGKFIEAAENSIKELLNSLLLIEPIDQKLHYSRAAYMLMDTSQANAYADIRNSNCFRLWESILEKDMLSDKISFKVFVNTVGAAKKNKRAIAMEIIIRSKTFANMVADLRIKYKFSGNSDISNELAFKLRQTVFSQEDSIFDMIFGSYYIEAWNILQAKTFRMLKAYPDDYSNVRKRIYAELYRYDKDVANNADIKLQFEKKEKKPDWFNIYKSIVSARKAMCNAARSFAIGGIASLNRGSNPIRSDPNLTKIVRGAENDR